MKTWKTLSKRTVLEPSRFLRVEEHRIELPDGRIIDDWPWLVLPDFINVVVVTPEGKFPCFRQTKYALTGTSIAPVGGYLEPGEDPLPCARRELREEAGYEADRWTALGAFAVDGNRGGGVAHFFLAEDARLVGRAESDDLEEQELLLLDRPALEAALDDAGIKNLPWTACFLLALRRLDRR